MAATSWADTDYDDPRLTTPPPTPAGRRFTEAITYKAATVHTRASTQILERDSLAYWQAHDRREGQRVRPMTSPYADMVACYLLGRQDMAQLHDEQFRADLRLDRSGAVVAYAACALCGAVGVVVLYWLGAALMALRCAGGGCG